MEIIFLWKNWEVFLGDTSCINQDFLMMAANGWLQFLFSLNSKGAGFYLHVHLLLFCESNLSIPHQQMEGTPEVCSFPAQETST